MSPQPDDDGLARLLRRLPAPEPSPQFAASARRRYLVALEARARREALTGFTLALIALIAIAALAATVIEPAALAVWLADVVADLARWTAGIGVILALVPPVAWDSVLLGSAATVLSLALLARARSAALAK